MQNKTRFYYILDQCELCLKKYSNKDLYPDYALYYDRYNRMIQELYQIKHALNSGNLSNDFRALEITNMLDMNDPDEIKDHILKLNQLYKIHIQKN
jgi:hypothetical protein